MGVRKKIIFTALFCLYMAAVLFLCLMKPDDMPQPELYFFGLALDKVAHFLMFTPFPVLAVLMFWNKERKVYADIILLLGIGLLGVGLATGTEYLQSLTQYRTSDIKDFHADICGLAAGCSLSLLMIILKRHIR